jgi:hypothetical protein
MNSGTVRPGLAGVIWGAIRAAGMLNKIARFLSSNMSRSLSVFGIQLEKQHLLFVKFHHKGFRTRM